MQRTLTLKEFLFKGKNSNLVLKLNQIKAFQQIEHTDSKWLNEYDFNEL